MRTIGPDSVRVPELNQGNGTRHTILLVHALDLKRELPAAFLHNIEICLVPLCRSCYFGAGELGERVET